MSVAWIVSALNVYCSLWGTMPFTVVKEPCLSLRLNPWKFAWVVVLALSSLCCLYTTPVFATDSPRHNESVNSFLLHVVDYETNIVSSMGTFKLINPCLVYGMSLSSHFVTIFCFVKRLPNLVEELNSVDSKMIHLTRKPLKTAHSAAIYFSLILFPIPVFMYYMWTFNIYDAGKLCWSVSQVLHNLVSYSCEIQLIMLCYAIGTRFRIINENFAFRSVRDSLYQTWLHPKDSIFNEVERLSVSRIEVAQDCYLDLCVLVRMLNEMYSFQILVSMGGCFLKALMNIYFAFFGAHTDLSRATRNVIKTVLWTFYYGGRFVSLAFVASYVIGQLYIFWRNACSQTLILSGCGLFQLHSSIVLKAMGAGMTYLFILVQYDVQFYFP